MKITFLITLLILIGVSSVAQTKRKTAPRSKQPPASKQKAERKLTPREIAAIAFPSSVSIYSLDTNGDLNIGAGFVAAPGIVATCYHVVKNSPQIHVTVMGKADEKHIAQIVRFDKKRDIALLAVKTLKAQPLHISEAEDYYVGEPIFTLGNPKGLEGTFSDGMISNFHQVDDIFLMQYTAPVSPGNSGGPILNNQGEVIAMVNMQLKEGQNLNFAMMAFQIRMLIEGQKEVLPGTYMDHNLDVPSTKRKPK